jgi:hypothetical protein
MSGSSDAWSTFRTGGGLTDGPPPPAGDDPWAAFRVGKPAPDPTREKAREANSTVGGMLSGTQRAVEQAYTGGFRDEAQAALNGIVSSGLTGVINMAQGRAPAFGETYNQVYDESLGRERTQTKQFAEDHPVLSIGGNIAGGALLGGAPARAAGQVLAPAMARLNPLLAGTLRVTGGGAAGGAVTGFGEGEGGFGPRLAAAGEGGAIGAGVGAAVHGLAGAVNRMANPIRNQLAPEALRIRDVARAEGIPMSVAQETGSPWLKNVEASLAQLPGSAGMEANAQRLQNEAFSRAAMRRAGEDVNNATPATLNASADRSGGVIGRIANANDLDASPPEFLDDLVRHSDAARRYAASDVERQTLSRIDDILGKVEAGDTIPGPAYRELRSEIGATLRTTQDGDLRRHLRGVMDTLDDRFNAGLSPEDAAAFAEARRHYANLHVVGDAMSGAGAGVARGQVSPLALRGALNKSTGGGYAWGEGDLNDLSRVGQDVLRNPPDSGTAGRTEANKVLTGSLAVGGAGAGFGIGGPVGAAVGAVTPFVLPSIAQRFLQSPAGRHWLVNGLGQIDPALVQAGSVAAGSTTARNRLMQD